jgi:hypothetical protein
VQRLKQNISTSTFAAAEDSINNRLDNLVLGCGLKFQRIHRYGRRLRIRFKLNDDATVICMIISSSTMTSTCDHIVPKVCKAIQLRSRDSEKIV